MAAVKKSAVPRALHLSHLVQLLPPSGEERLLEAILQSVDASGASLTSLGTCWFFVHLYDMVLNKLIFIDGANTLHLQSLLEKYLSHKRTDALIKSTYFDL